VRASIYNPLGFCTKEQAVTMALRTYEEVILKNTQQDGVTTPVNNTISSQVNHTIAAGKYFSFCVSGNDSALYGWGKNENNQFGADTEDSARQKVKTARDVKYIASQSAHNFYIDKSSNLYGFGDNTYAQLGDGTYNKKTEPVLIASEVASVIPLKDHTFIIKTDGSLYAFGKGENYKLGTNSDKDSIVPVKILDEVAKISAYSDCTMALTKDGKVYVWGQEKNNSLLFETQIKYKQPTLIGEGATDIAVGNDFGFFIKKNGELYAFGQNRFGQLSTGKSGLNAEEKTPIKVMDGVSKIYAANNMSMAILSMGICIPAVTILKEGLVRESRIR
jgi:alpha-tubulin suppressor-like RCC1 family protein